METGSQWVGSFSWFIVKSYLILSLLLGACRLSGCEITRLDQAMHEFCIEIYDSRWIKSLEVMFVLGINLLVLWGSFQSSPYTLLLLFSMTIKIKKTVIHFFQYPLVKLWFLRFLLSDLMIDQLWNHIDNVVFISFILNHINVR